MPLRALPLLLALVIAAACGEAAAGPTPDRPDPLAGNYLALSAESAVPLATELVTAFSALHPGMTWTVRDVGSSAVLALIKSGDADAGFISREPSITERNDTLIIGLGFTPQVIVVNSANPVTDLSAAQLRGIFGGTITDWAAVGGTPGPIRVFIRPESSPTRIALDPLLVPSGATYAKAAVSVPDAPAMLAVVAAVPGAIGIVSALNLGIEPTSPRPIAVAGVAPSRVNTASGTYPYRRPLYLVSRHPGPLGRAGAMAFRDFVHGEDGQKILRAHF